MPACRWMMDTIGGGKGEEGTKSTRRENTEDERCEGYEREEHEGVESGRCGVGGGKNTTTEDRASTRGDHVEIESRRILKPVSAPCI